MRKTQLPTPLPVQQFARCIDDTARPAGYIGDWPHGRPRVPRAGAAPRAQTGKAHVHVLGFYVERPYGAFAAHRFEPKWPRCG